MLSGKINHNLLIPFHGIILREYGDNENIGDWLIFCDFLRKEKQALSVMVIHSNARDEYQGYRRQVNMTTRPNDIHYQLRRMVKECQNKQVLPLADNMLTHREWAVLRRLCHGEKPLYISKVLGIHQKTVSAHKTRALRKLGVSGLPSLLMKHKGLLVQVHKAESILGVLFIPPEQDTKDIVFV